MATLIGDAGGKYLWEDKKQAGRIPMGIEEVMKKAVSADIWINPGPHTTYTQLKISDNRLEVISAFKNSFVYNATKTLNKNGGNAYWESGVVRPDLVLADLIKIIHPELLPDHSWVFYEPLKL